MELSHDFLIEKLKSSEYSEYEIRLILNGLSSDKITSFRINRLKTTVASIEKSFDELEISYSKNIDFPDAFILDNYFKKDDFDSKTGLRLNPFTFYKEGHIYVQSLSSMMPVYVLEPKASENILDMCAAPGSKTTFIQSLTKNKSNLTAVELHKDRYEKLTHNVKVQGANVLLMNMNALDLDDMFKFDKILLDAPCSGSGTLDITSNRYKKNFTDELINKCISTQKKLIKKAYKLLNKGGELIYSTCSLLKYENEDIVDYAIKNGFNIDFCRFKTRANKFSIGSSVNENVYIKIFPDKIWEGFFIAKLKKDG